MKIFKIIFFSLILLNFSQSIADENKLQNKITKNLRCLICQGQSVYDSDSQFANSLKILVEKKISEGKNEEQIYNYLKDKYGEWILYDPNLNKNTYFLWLLPLIAFILGGVIIFKTFIIKKKLSIFSL